MQGGAPNVAGSGAPRDISSMQDDMLQIFYLGCESIRHLCDWPAPFFSETAAEALGEDG